MVKMSNIDDLQRLADVVEKRAGQGPSEIVSGWQDLLKDILLRMKPFLRAGTLVTFQTLNPAETLFFKRLYQRVTMPASAVGFYLPPSVRQQMLGGSEAVSRPDGKDPDAGVVVASRAENHDVIVNALFAFPPFTPAVDVYEQGQLAAGHQYASIDDCLAELGQILDRYLYTVNMSN